jgi:hypothetical protein
MDAVPKPVYVPPNNFVHASHSCKECSIVPKGNLYRCKVCRNFFLCESCFQNVSHSEHAFDFTPRKFTPWKAAMRAVAPILPTNLIQNLQHRELTEQDYQMLLTLDSGPQQQGTIPLQIINSFPVIKLSTAQDCLRVRLDAERVCTVCVEKITYGDLVRQIPCGHGFHQACIDKWLLHQRSTCPSCGSAAYTCLDPENGGPPDMEKASYVAAKQQYGIVNPKARQKRRQKKKQVPDILNTRMATLMITGSEALHRPVRLPPIQNNSVLEMAPAAESTPLAIGNVTPSKNSCIIKRKPSSIVRKLCRLPPIRDAPVKLDLIINKIV